MHTISKNSVDIPKAPVPRRFRPPKKNIPQTPQERSHILRMVRRYVQEQNPVPPLPAEELKRHADHLVEQLQCEPLYRDYIGVLVNNEIWREPMAQIPYERRLLLLPKCLRVEEKCPAPFDEFGLLCKQCGLCSIQEFQAEAERLGYAVLVAEGSAIVMELIQTGKIEAIVGVSCLSVLERAFPYMEAAAIPGMAIPLLQDDCIDTTVDLDWVWEVIHLTSDDKTRRLDLGALREEVQSWFTAESLQAVLGTPEEETETVAQQWLAQAGKRWRPFLAIAVYQALREDPEAPLPEDLKKIAIAVECFHKASLVHDDIEDGDSERYGEKALHEQHGTPVALNVGDLLIGEGYRMIGECEAAPEEKNRMLLVASQGQRQLCRGQGAELCWAKSPAPLSSKEVLSIFQKKTAPAFEVALRLGALYAGRHDSVTDVLGRYSEALGVAYQVRDDLTDFDDGSDCNDITGGRPNILLAIAHEKAKGEQKKFLESLWKRNGASDASVEEIVALYRELKADERAQVLQEGYKEEAIRALGELENANLKGLMRRVIGKIFNEMEIKGWCKEFEAQNGVQHQGASDTAATTG